MTTSPIPTDHLASHAQDRAAAALGAERSRLDRVVAELGANELDLRTEEEDLGEVASASQHPADVASETLEREIELGLIDDFRAALAEVAAAERRVVAGTYGTCERCGGAVGDERLVAVPATRWCLPCAEAVERDARWRTPGPRRRLGALHSDEFLARDDRSESDGDNDDLSGEEAALTVRALLVAD